MEAIYLDYAATTPVRAEVRDAMAPYLADEFGNPSSVHGWGRRAREALEASREGMAEALGAAPREVTFVRGGTESDNLALLGWGEARRAEGSQPTLAVLVAWKNGVGGRSCPRRTRPACEPPGPWQASHCNWPCPNGPRGSDGTACFVRKIAKTGPSS